MGARTLLKSTHEASLLVHPAPTQPALAKGTETQAAEEFVKKLQVRISKRQCHGKMPVGNKDVCRLQTLYIESDARVSKVEVAMHGSVHGPAWGHLCLHCLTGRSLAVSTASSFSFYL